MILAIDIGNTNIVVGCIDDKKTYFIEKIMPTKFTTIKKFNTLSTIRIFITGEIITSFRIFIMGKKNKNKKKQ